VKGIPPMVRPVERGRTFVNIGPVASTPVTELEIPVHVSLQPVGDDPQQEVLRRVRWRAPPEHGAPAGLEA
jgi:hypothetical protein